MSKRVVAFTANDDIPDNAKFLYAKTELVSSVADHNCDCHPLQNCHCTIDTYVKYFYYEVVKKDD